MSELSIIVEPIRPRRGSRSLSAGCATTMLRRPGSSSFIRWGLSSKTMAARLWAGCLGNITGGWLHVRSLWVDTMWRGRGYAIELMAAAERYAIAKRCVAAGLQTASYEARPLYEKLGYRVFCELDDHPVKGHRRFHMTKRPLTGIDAPRRDPRDHATLTMSPYASADVQGLITRGIQTHALRRLGGRSRCGEAPTSF